MEQRKQTFAGSDYIITIQRMKENNETYYLAMCPSVPGFLAEGDTYDELVSIIDTLFPIFMNVQATRRTLS